MKSAWWCWSAFLSSGEYSIVVVIWWIPAADLSSVLFCRCRHGWMPIEWLHRRLEAEIYLAAGEWNGDALPTCWFQLAARQAMANVMLFVDQTIFQSFYLACRARGMPVLPYTWLSWKTWSESWDEKEGSRHFSCSFLYLSCKYKPGFVILISFPPSYLVYMCGINILVHLLTTTTKPENENGDERADGWMMKMAYHRWRLEWSGHGSMACRAYRNIGHLKCVWIA